MVTYSVGRFIQVGLALSLGPALLIVLAVGAIGMLVLATTRLITDIVVGQACQPREPVGRELFRS
jgi:hypothetical protein